jgi:hypothetical protein
VNFKASRTRNYSSAGNAGKTGGNASTSGGNSLFTRRERRRRDSPGAT